MDQLHLHKRFAVQQPKLQFIGVELYFGDLETARRTPKCAMTFLRSHKLLHADIQIIDRLRDAVNRD
jgi:hypothetical protein